MEKNYDKDGYLIVSEMDSCPLWEWDKLPGCAGGEQDCFYCAFSNFRQDDYIQSLGNQTAGEKLYSICRNEKNKK